MRHYFPKRPYSSKINIVRRDPLKALIIDAFGEGSVALKYCISCHHITLESGQGIHSVDFEDVPVVLPVSMSPAVLRLCEQLACKCSEFSVAGSQVLC